MVKARMRRKWCYQGGSFPFGNPADVLDLLPAGVHCWVGGQKIFLCPCNKHASNILNYIVWREPDSFWLVEQLLSCVSLLSCTILLLKVNVPSSFFCMASQYTVRENMSHNTFVRIIQCREHSRTLCVQMFLLEATPTCPLSFGRADERFEWLLNNGTLN